jgi:hypothetical protein
VVSYNPLLTFLDRLSKPGLSSRVLNWACPVPFFGGLDSARVASVGINPSASEFLGSSGLELDGVNRRFPTLRSLGLRSWNQIGSDGVIKIRKACDQYFLGNPYTRWFGVLETLFTDSGLTYYGREPSICHLDLVPYATSQRWGDLDQKTRSDLISLTRDSLALVVQESNIEVIVLNGRSVVASFQELTRVDYQIAEMPAWNLPRTSTPVGGLSYTGRLDSIGGVSLERSVRVLGFNHNLQSSFGVTREVVSAIGSWLTVEGISHLV